MFLCLAVVFRRRLPWPISRNEYPMRVDSVPSGCGCTVSRLSGETVRNEAGCAYSFALVSKCVVCNCLPDGFLRRPVSARARCNRGEHACGRVFASIPVLFLGMPISEAFRTLFGLVSECCFCQIKRKNHNGWKNSGVSLNLRPKELIWPDLSEIGSLWL